ncbi:MAG: MFS transporter [Planctomycetes bacterium]|nr:MFS transporter [Planctomycetota bacterium]
MSKTPLLCVMMFLQFFIWGSWYVTAPRVLGPLGFGGPEFGWTYAVGPIAGMISPLFVGMIVDRFFASQRVLGLLHLIGAAVMWYASTLMVGEAAGPGMINTVFLAYMLCYFPTLSLTNTVALHQFTDAEKEFPRVRVFGTIGWIVAGLVLSTMGWGASVHMFHLSAGAGVLMGLFSFVLPHTPPPAAGQPFSATQALGLDALSLLKQPAFLVFMFCSFLICIPLAFYYQMAERTLGAGYVEDTPFKMTFGQMSEIFFMVVMPFFFRRLGVKWMLAVGMAAWVVRYGLFHLGMPDGTVWMLLLGVALHGICYDFFFVTGQIYTDRVAPRELRGQAQGMLVLFTLGLGMLIGAQVAGAVEASHTDQAAIDAIDARLQPVQSEAAAIVERLGEAAAVNDARWQELNTQIQTGGIDKLRAIDWSGIWLIPCLLALGVLILFVFTFRPARRDDE